MVTGLTPRVGRAASRPMIVQLDVSTTGLRLRTGRACPVTTPPSTSAGTFAAVVGGGVAFSSARSEEHTSELQSLAYLVCRLLLEKKKTSHRVTERQPHTPRIK